MRILLLIALLLFSCSPHRSQSQSERNNSAAQQPQKFQVIVPMDTWEAIYFKEVNERATIARLPNLRAAALPKDDLETRVWMGFGLTALRGLILKRSAGQWTGIHVQGIHPRLASRDYQKTLQTPKSGWDECWRRLVNEGILTLPDARSINCEGGALDGISYVVETNLDNTYRTYMYDNPQFAKCKEAKQMIKIVEILADEFGAQLRGD